MTTPGQAATTLGGSIASKEYWDSVSYLESAFHHGFMKLRLKNSEFVYHENSRLVQELDEFCDVDTMHTVKGPIILLGDSGVGKSAFLANWLARRKKMVQNWQSSYPEFIFTHVVGCSRQSCSVSNLLERVLREIKDYFELNKEVPEVEERLSWQFPKFLEAASKKGRVILVVDGLQRLRTNGGESILKWVPLAFPPNVRIIFTGTVNYPSSKFAKAEESPIGDHYEKTSMSAQMIERIKLEASRRNWKLVNVTPLTEDDRRRIIKKFVYKNRSATGSKKNDDKRDGSASRPGLQLFEIQQKAIVSVPMSANAHFLKVFLMSMLWAVREGFNIHSIFESWLNSDSVGQLLEAILRSMEIGYTPTEEATADAKQFLAETMKSATPSIGVLKRASSPVVPRLHREGPGSPTKDKSPLSSPTASMMRRSSLDRGGSPPSGRRSARIGMATNETIIDFKANNDYRPSSAMTRAKSIHETQEVFVETERKLRSFRGRMKGSGSSTDFLFEGDSRAFFESNRSMLTSDTGSVSSIISSLPTSRIPTPGSTLGSAASSPKLSMNGEPTPGTDSIESPNNILPAYMTGGKHVPPLGPLLGKALSILYVSRHGMLVNELRFILSAMMTEAREQRHKQHRPCEGYDSVMERSSSGAGLAFSDTEWKALLRAIKPMGVLFVQDAIVLPMCKDILRDVIWWRYIGSEQMEQTYHQWLIRFFRIHPTTFRRVEELPWHLQRCYEWDALRSVLVNLPMFQLLYTANYKRELYSYWKKLSQGPLLNYAAGVDAPLDPPVYIAPYDVVKEYGKSLEDWYKSSRPPTKTFLPMVQLATKFMYDFCVYLQGFLPVFQHAPFDLKRLYQDGFTFAEDLPHVYVLSGPNALAVAAAASASSPAHSNSATVSPGSLGVGSMTPSMSAATALALALEAFTTLGRSPAGSSLSPNASSTALTVTKQKPVMPNHFFYYQRWIWIQFPWLALTKEILIRDPVVSNPKSNVSIGSAGSELSGLDLWGSSTNLTSNNQQMVDSMVGTSRDSIDGGTSNNNPSDERNPTDGSTSVAPFSGAGGTTQARSGLFDARFWDVKKSMFDVGTQKLKGSMSAAQLAAVQRASVKISQVPIPTPVTQTLDIISHENVFHKKSTFAAVQNVLGSSVRALPTAILNISASTPALTSLSTTSNSSASPVEKSNPVAVRTFLTESSGSLAGSTSPTQPRACSPSRGEIASITTLSSPVNDNNNAKAGFQLGTNDSEYGMFVPEVSGNNGPNSSAAFGLPAHVQDYPQSEWDLKKSYNHRVVLKLQTLHDSLRAESQRKKAHLESVKAKIKETARRYDSAMRDCEMAKQAVEEMISRAQKIDQMMKNIDHQEKTRRKLMRGCELFPAYDPEHYEDCKKELKLLQLTLRDLEEEKRVLLAKKMHLQNNELPALRTAMERNKQLLQAVVDKLERARDKIAHEQATTDTLFQRRAEMIDNVQTGGKLGEAQDVADEKPDSAAQNESSRRTGFALKTGRSSSSSAGGSANGSGGSTRSLAVKIALQRCESMCDKVQKATGFSRMEAVYQKFSRREELNASFDEQAKINEARLKQMKLTQSELEHQLHSLEVSNAVASMEDPRSLEQKLRDAEVELARTEYTQTSLLTTSKEVIAGAARIVKLMGLTSCASPLKNAIPAAKLWPPPAGYEGESRLASEFEALGADAITNLLQICLDRAALMVDTIEGGRGDPDASFMFPDSRNRRRSTKVEERMQLLGRAARSGRRSTNVATVALAATSPDRKDRFDRGTTPLATAAPAGAATIAVDGAASRPLELAAPEEPEDADEAAAPLSRESIKASSRARLAPRARRDRSERLLPAPSHLHLDVEDGNS